MPLIHTYRPKKLAHIIGQQSACQKLRNAVKEKRAAFIYGPPGTGKTSAVHALCKEEGMELIELNASDFRNKQQIESILGPALGQRSLFMQEKLLLIDELDGISGSKDRGGMQALLPLLTSKSAAIVLVANDPWDKKFYALRKQTVQIPFTSLSYLSIANILEQICKEEQITYDKEDLKRIARRSDGDARAAINDLEIISTEGSVRAEDVDLLGERDRTQKLHDALLRIFKTLEFDHALHALDEVQEDYEKIMLIIDENIPKEYSGKDLERAYEELSRADIFSRRIRRRQEWRYLVYIFFLMSVGVALSKDAKYKGFTNYDLTSERLKKLFMGKQHHALRDQVAEKLARATHCSTKEVIMHMLPILRIILQRFNKEEVYKLQQQLELNEEEIRYLQ